ncbi:MAG: ATP-binding protein, partial [Proteobacteria bacterium]|nr:ATP-binding protein [Pseudomonadota bacterium]
EFAPVGYLTLTPEGLIEEVNLTGVKLLGIERGNLLHKGFRTFVIHDDQDRWVRHFINMTSHDGQGTVELAMQRGDGTVFHALVDTMGGTSFPVPALRITITDITDLKKAERRIKERELELSAIIENEPECVKQLAKDCSLLQMNRAGLNMIEADSLDQVVGLSVLGIVVPEYKEAFMALAHEVFQGNSGILEFEIIGLKGAHRWLESHAVPLCDSQGNIISLLSITRDITERKKTEEELGRSNAELEQFSYAISHDMRQPLRMVSSYLKLLEEGISGKIDDEQREYFNFAIDGAKRIDSMMVGLLEYSRIGRKGEPLAWIESRTVLDEVLLFLQPAIAEAQADLRIQGDWPRILVSSDEILRLLQNLVGNAIKFRVAGRTPEITVTSETVGREWRVSIADNGAGIIPDQIGRLFQVFQRLHSHAAYEGTGIGLALCRKITEHHGGRIWAESRGVGQGSRFCIALPQESTEIL